MKKKILVYTLAFLSSLFIFDRILINILSGFEVTLYRQRNFKDKFISTEKKPFDILIMGSSRSKRGILPFYFFNYGGLRAKNIARNACSAKFNYLFYNEYRKYTKKPRAVIYGVDYFIFKLKSNPRWLKYFSDGNAGSTMKRPGLLRLISNKPQIDLLINNFILNLSDNFRKGSVKNQTSNSDIDDFTGFPGSISQKIQRTSNFKKYSYEKYPGEEGLYFSRLIKLLDQDHIPTIIVYIPEYIGTYESNFQRDLFYKSIKKIVSFSPSIHFLNYNDPLVFPLNEKSYFSDGGWGFANSHLSKKGAKRFNRILIRDVKDILTGLKK